VGSAVSAVITRPLLSEGNLILPEGTLIEGEVTEVKAARRFGRNGRLRFRLNRTEMPSGVSQLVSGTLEAAEVDRRSRIKLDAEGGARVAFSKMKLAAPAIAVAVAMTGVPDDEPGSPTVQGSAPGWTGFGILGSAAALIHPAAASPLGIWGAANSIYFKLIRKGDEMQLPKNTLLEIRFGRTPAGTQPVASGDGCESAPEGLRAR